MAEPKDDSGADALHRSEKPTETLSQFVARVLDQLSVSAWLPSAALVLLLAFVFQLGSALDSKPPCADQAINCAVSAMARTSIGGALLLLVAVVVSTILTQAFTFEAIRTLEGYWGTLRIAEWVAKARCGHFREQRLDLKQRYDKLTREAWAAARNKIEEEQAEAIDRRNDDADVRAWTPDMLAYLGASLIGHTPSVDLNASERAHALSIPWERYAPADLLRRQVNLDKCLRDYPRPDRMLPTRLGNVLRSHEDQLGRKRVETFVLEIYDLMPASLRIQHNEQRNRLDLYCSMMFVVVIVTIAAVGRLGTQGPQGRWYAVVAIVAGLVAMWLTYRAAISSARVYGILLIDIARRFPAGATRTGQQHQGRSATTSHKAKLDVDAS